MSKLRKSMRTAVTRKYIAMILESLESNYNEQKNATIFMKLFSRVDLQYLKAILLQIAKRIESD